MMLGVPDVLYPILAEPVEVGFVTDGLPVPELTGTVMLAVGTFVNVVLPPAELTARNVTVSPLLNVPAKSMVISYSVMSLDQT